VLDSSCVKDVRNLRASDVFPVDIHNTQLNRNTTGAR
jgi:hypothetical protein